MMHVKLIRYTPDPDRTVAMSARLCYSPIGAEELETKLSERKWPAWCGGWARWGTPPLSSM